MGSAANLKSGSLRTLTFDEVEQVLISFSASVLNKETAEEVYWSLAKNVISRLGFVDCVIYSVNRRTRSLVQRAAYGPKSPAKQVILRPLTIPLGAGITGSVAQTGRAEKIADTSKDPRYIVDDEARFAELDQTQDAFGNGFVVRVIDVVSTTGPALPGIKIVHAQHGGIQGQFPGAHELGHLGELATLVGSGGVDGGEEVAHDSVHRGRLNHDIGGVPMGATAVVLNLRHRQFQSREHRRLPRR